MITSQNNNVMYQGEASRGRVPSARVGLRSARRRQLDAPPRRPEHGDRAEEDPDHTLVQV